MEGLSRKEILKELSEIGYVTLSELKKNVRAFEDYMNTHGEKDCNKNVGDDNKKNICHCDCER